MNYIRIQQNTLWFRSAPEIYKYNSIESGMLNTQKCTDTGKNGIYFGNRMIISISMCLEYNKLLEFGMFQLMDDINISDDKYAFRQINPHRYLDIENNLIPYVDVIDKENISHITEELQVLKINKYTDKLEYLLPDNLQKELNLNSCELFLTKNDIKKIKLIATFRFNKEIIKTPNDLLLYLETNNYPFDIDKYIDDKILIKYVC